MPNERKIRLVKRHDQTYAYGYRITSIYWVSLPNGETKFIEVSESRYDPNGNGTGNFSESITVRIIPPEEMEEEASLEVVDLIFQLLDQNSADGKNVEIKVQQGPKDGELGIAGKIPATSLTQRIREELNEGME